MLGKQNVSGGTVAQQVTSKGQPLKLYRARYIHRRADSADLKPVPPVEFRAVNEFQARKIGEGIARKNNWAMTSVGLA